MKLIVFDVDGTLVDSQADILAAMARAFAGVGLAVPNRAAVLSIVGLSLPQAMAQLAPEVDPATRDQLVEGYKAAYVTLRGEKQVQETSPLYPGMAEMLAVLSAREDLLLGVATGKSRRGLDKLLQGHGMERMFVTQQVADHHPSKPHPSMLLSAMADCGTAPAETVMIGDTSFDMEMAQAAGCAGIAVGWGYHPPARLVAARHHLGRIEDLPGLLNQMWELDL